MKVIGSISTLVICWNYYIVNFKWLQAERDLIVKTEPTKLLEKNSMSNYVSPKTVCQTQDIFTLGYLFKYLMH